ncbi:hypothetical protein AMD24_00676 [Candidatus Xiphinematobacter sp. Idaho Grape]|nr:hypothetical protein AMD24_00676 [Candidatus Xiphinematobacter sp. Idaho Grape]
MVTVWILSLRGKGRKEFRKNVYFVYCFIRTQLPPLLPLYIVIFIETSSVPDKCTKAFLLVETGQVA